MTISRYFCLFVIYSFFGWIYETTFCTLKEGRWRNRGFLYGPICPIYGTGAIIISLLLKLAAGLEAWQLFLISLFGSAVLEYLTSWVLEQLFHAVWWDYSRLPFNLHGRISLFTTLGFGLGGLLIGYVIVPFTEKAVSMLPTAAIELLALLFCSLLMVDLTLTVTALRHFDRMVAELDNAINTRMEHLVDSVIQAGSSLRHEIIESKYVSSLSGFAKGAVSRIYAIRYGNNSKESAGRRFLSMIKKNDRDN